MSWLLRSWLSILLGLVIGVSLIGVCGFILRGASIKAHFADPKLFEVTYQFLLVTVVGGSIAYLYKKLEHRREERRVLRDMHSELLNAYNKAKSIRRHLRASLGTACGADPEKMVDATEYGREMVALSDAQLIFEVYAKRAEDSSLWIGGGTDLACSLRKVEQYLHEIVKEYEQQFVHFAGDPPVRELGKLERLIEFIGPHNKADQFKKCFQCHGERALRLLGEVIPR